MGLTNVNKLRSVGRNRVAVMGSFRPNGATGIVANSTKGRGYSVARTSAGLYTLTFTDKASDLDSVMVSARSASGTPTQVTAGDYSASAKTLQIRVMQAAAGATGFIPIDVSSFLEIAGNAIQNLAAHGGLMAVDSDPRLERINGATDPSLRIRWGSASTAEIQIPNIPIPENLDPAQDIYLKLLAGKSGDASPTATLTAEIHEHPLMDVAAGMFGQGDSWPNNIGGAIVINNTTPGQGIGNAMEYSLTVAAAGLDGPPGFIVITLTPSNNAAAAIDLYGAYIEYSKTGSGSTYTLADMTADVDNVVNFTAIFRNSSVDA